MAFSIDILKQKSLSALGSNPNIVSSPVWFYVCALHLRSEPAKALKNISLLGTSKIGHHLHNTEPHPSAVQSISIFFQHIILSEIPQATKTKLKKIPYATKAKIYPYQMYRE